MASGTVHKCSSVLAAVVAYKLIPYHLHDLNMLIVSMLGGYFGATAPDWMEISSAKRTASGAFVRTSVIPHRTITHWVPLWLISLYLTYAGVMSAVEASQVQYAFMFAFSVGGVLHLILDAPNPMGIPIWTPTKMSRIRVNKKYGLWKSGQMEWLLIPLMFVLAVLIYGL